MGDTPVDAAQLEARLGVAFRDRELLDRALTHRSYAFEHGGTATNERLEFLGDAVLALVVTEIVYAAMPDAPEGTLAKLRAAAVKSSALADVAQELDLGAVVRLGKGEIATGGREKVSILADTFEAVLGAVHLDQGFEVASQLIRTLFADRLHELSKRGAALDYKTSLQELAAAEYRAVPVYVLEEDGPDHEKHFTATVEVAGEIRGRGTGPSKKKAEQAAAREAYRRMTGARREQEAEGARAP